MIECNLVTLGWAGARWCSILQLCKVKFIKIWLFFMHFISVHLKNMKFLPKCNFVCLEFFSNGSWVLVVVVVCLISYWKTMLFVKNIKAILSEVNEQAAFANKLVELWTSLSRSRRRDTKWKNPIYSQIFIIFSVNLPRNNQRSLSDLMIGL